LFKVIGLSITATPGSEQKVYFSTSLIDEDIPSNQEYFESINQTDSSLEFTFNLRKCLSGESFSETGAWAEWESDSEYLIGVKTSPTSCIPCPTLYAKCLGGSTIVPKAGYWRSSSDTDEILECFNIDACNGYTEENQDLLGGWATGYQGTMWADCKPKYSRTGDYQCGKCPDNVLNIIRITGFLLLMILILFILVKFTIQGANNKRNVLAVYNRILVNHVQMVVIIYSFRLKWPDNFESLYGPSEKAGEVTQQFISFDCFIDKRTSTNLDANVMSLYFYRVIIAAALPIIVFFVTYIIWSIIFLFYLCKKSPERELNKKKFMKRLNEQKKIRISATNMIILIFLHPSLLEILFKMFNWQDVDGVLRLTEDFEVTCYEGTHLWLVLGVVIPFLIIWGIGIPAYALVRLIKNKINLDQKEVREELGYLYNGYSAHGFYWEPVIMLRKFIMVFFATIQSLAGKRIQGMLGFAFLVVCIILHNAILPFMSLRLNVLESMSIIALLISMYCGVFFVTDKNNNLTAKESGNEFSLSGFEKTILFLMFVLSNLFFLMYWGILFMIESKRYFRIKFQKIYHSLCLCGNKTAIEKEKLRRMAFMRSDEMLDNYLDLRNLIKKTKSVVKDGEHPQVVEYLLYMNQQLKEMKKEENNIKEIANNR
jgi:hypothetical protein